MTGNTHSVPTRLIMGAPASWEDTQCWRPGPVLLPSRGFSLVMPTPCLSPAQSCLPSSILRVKLHTHPPTSLLAASRLPRVSCKYPGSKAKFMVSSFPPPSYQTIPPLTLAVSPAPITQAHDSRACLHFSSPGCLSIRPLPVPCHRDHDRPASGLPRLFPRWVCWWSAPWARVLS